MKSYTDMTETSTTLSSEAFARIAAPRLGPLLEAATYMARECPLDQAPVFLTRPLLGRILSECAILEEFFDSFGAHRNSRFYPMRELLAVGGVFSAVGYKLLHINHSLPRYHLSPVKGDFQGDTWAALNFISRILRHAMVLLAEQAEEVGIHHAADCGAEDFSEFNEIGTLVADRDVPASHSDTTILSFCTELLSLMASALSMSIVDSPTLDDWRTLIPERVNEDNIRHLVQEFHRFKSLYDTGLAMTKLERANTDLPALRGHVSVVSHLCEAGLGMVHFYERHLDCFQDDAFFARHELVTRDALLEFIFGYLARYAGRYSTVIRRLCLTILSKHSEVGTMMVPIPPYRGFHVRPSTMIAKIARHYGGALTMRVLNETYDATRPLDLFRANESINAVKRMRLAEHLETVELPAAVQGVKASEEMVRGVILKLAEKRALVIYEQPLPIDSDGKEAGGNVLAFVVDQIKKLLALGKIDFNLPIEASFTGDTRVLEDIKVLAACGYGEDRQGHNIPLPEKLSYLQKTPMTT
ncbi:MAG: hypothetical protein RRC34_13225 [Lentisphaeria bacterium]|nr:hypothetical protein [Lentisphaeria bacterium]